MDIMTYDLVYVPKREFQRIDERPIYLFHSARDVDVDPNINDNWNKRKDRWKEE